MKHTKIVATVGPSSESKERLIELVNAGVNVFRLNFSHGEHEWHGAIIDRVREISEELHIPIAILADIQGPRIRTRIPKDPFHVTKGDHVFVGDLSNEKSFPETVGHQFFFDQPEIIRDIEVDESVLLEDGLLKFTVVKKEGNALEIEAMNDGDVKHHKGVNLPDSKLHIPIITEKDEKDLRFVVEKGVDYVGLSFVGSANDIKETRKIMAGTGISEHLFPKVVAKIERKEAIKNLHEIAREADAVMVARGDLGIELPETKVTLFQKEIISESLSAVRPVIVATQMMKSMVENPRPTRAEVSDVTNAVIDHADAVMLSEESAMGKYPVETVRTMAEIIANTEESPYDDVYQAIGMNLRSEYATIVRSVYELAKSYDARAILLLSESGFTARLMSHFRPEAKIFVATTNRRTWNRLALLWGVDASLFEDNTDLDNILDRLMNKLLQEGKVKKGERAVLCLGRHRANDRLQLVGVREIG